MDNSLETYPKILQRAGYRTAMFGKWHPGHGPAHDPTGFDEWAVLPDQGEYHNPDFSTPRGRVRVPGYVTDIITDMALDWLDGIDGRFALMVHHKAPHRTWEPDAAHALMYDDVDIPEPSTLFDDHATKSEAARAARCRMLDLNLRDFKVPVPDGMTGAEEIRWRYQRYIKECLRAIVSLDDNVGRLLDRLDGLGLAENTIVVYTSDQGFFLGDHGRFDKRFMYEESLGMPPIIRYPKRVPAGYVASGFGTNVDYAPTFLELVGAEIPDWTQGRSFAPPLDGQERQD